MNVLSKNFKVKNGINETELQEAVTIDQEIDRY